MSEFHKGQEVWVKGVIGYPTPDLHGDIEVALPACGLTAIERGRILVHCSAVVPDPPKDHYDREVLEAARNVASSYRSLTAKEAYDLTIVSGPLARTCSFLMEAVEAADEAHKPRIAEDVISDELAGSLTEHKGAAYWRNRSVAIAQALRDAGMLKEGDE